VHIRRRYVRGILLLSVWRRPCGLHSRRALPG
jgi:hypothetical protein